MLSWNELDPARFERAVQQLLKTQHPGLVSIDGSGGDGGRDAQLVTSDGLTVFEVKSFRRRLTSSARRQIEHSLSTAVSSAESMTRWELIVPLNPTPGELAWFDGKLANIAPGVRLEWRGIDWLDGHAAANEAFRRYVEGSNSQLLKAASELGLEQAILANGAIDLFARNTTMRDRVDGISMHWTLDWAIEGRIQSYSLRPKHPDANKVDPVTLTTELNFDPADDEAVVALTQWEDVLGYGGTIKLDAKYVRDVAVHGSEEARLLLAGMSGPGALSLLGKPVDLDRPLKATVEVRNLEAGSPPARADIWFRTRTSGSQGVHLHGGDASGAITVGLKIPYPTTTDTGDATSAQQLSDGGGFKIDFDSPWRYNVADIIPALHLQNAMRSGGELSIRVHQVVHATTTLEADPESIDYSLLLRVAQIVEAFERRLGLELRLPDGASTVEVSMAEAAVAALDNEPVALPFETFRATIVPGQAAALVDQIPEEPFALFSAHTDFVVTIGDLDIPYGPIAMSMPQILLTNREELLATPANEEPQAIFRTAGMPMFFTGRSNAEEHAASMLSEDPDPNQAA